jgi:H+-transporting ATPase
MDPSEVALAETKFAPEPDTDLHTGLTTAQVAERLAKYGPNEVVTEEEPEWKKIVSRYCGVVPLIMLATSLLSIAVVTTCPDDSPTGTSCKCREDRDLISFILLFCELNLIVIVDYFGEKSSSNAIKELKRLSAPTTRVKRNGEWSSIPKVDLVPGDIVALVIGATIPSDGRLRGDGPPEKFAPLKVDAASVTGEPLPESKRVGDEVLAACTVLSGELEMQVTATGARSSMGEAMALVHGVGEKGGGLKFLMARLAKIVALGATIVCLAVFLVLVMRDSVPVAQALKQSFVILVAVLPVAMPVVITTGLAVGALELSEEKAIVQRLGAIEELAGMDILCSDKTGTLTLGRMNVDKANCCPASYSSLEELLLTALLASRRENCDAIDKAVCEAYQSPVKAVENFEEHSFEPFSPLTKKTEAVVSRGTDSKFHVAKGAPEVMMSLLGIDESVLEWGEQAVEEKSARGFKTLGVARSEDGQQWTLLGFLAILDPPRHDTRDTIDRAIELGVDVKMITGDQRLIALEVASQLGMGQNIFGNDVWLANSDAVDMAGGLGELSEMASGFASVKPKHKYKVVKALQDRKHIVGMTGDGVNDAPALAVANVGIAVADATDAARAAADIVLTKEGLSTIVRAIDRSRMIFRRLEEYIIYRLASSTLILGFFALSILVLDFEFPTWVLILLSIVNDLTVMATSKDNVRSSAFPLIWDVPKVVYISVLIGGICCLQCFLLLYFVQNSKDIDWLEDIGLKDLEECEIVAVVYLNLGICIQLNIFSARNKKLFFQSDEEIDAAPPPAPFLLIPVISAILLTIFLAVYWDETSALGSGAPMKGCGWAAAGATIVWCLLWFIVIEIAKVLAYAIYDGDADGSMAILFNANVFEMMMKALSSTKKKIKGKMRGGKEKRRRGSYSSVDELTGGVSSALALSATGSRADTASIANALLTDHEGSHQNVLPPLVSVAPAAEGTEKEKALLDLVHAMQEHMLSLERRVHALDGQTVRADRTLLGQTRGRSGSLDLHSRKSLIIA